TKAGARLFGAYAIPQHRCNARARHACAGGEAKVAESGASLFRARQHVVAEIAGRPHRAEQMNANDRVRREVRAACNIGANGRGVAAGNGDGHFLSVPFCESVLPAFSSAASPRASVNRSYPTLIQSRRSGEGVKLANGG